MPQVMMAGSVSLPVPLLSLQLRRMTDVSILVMVVASLVFQVSDATIGSRKDAEEDFTWNYNGEVNIGE